MAKLEDLKAGTMVAAYSYSGREVGNVVNVESHEKGIVSVLLETEKDFFAHKLYHFKQLRILKPKRIPREWWVNSDPLSTNPAIPAVAGNPLNESWGDMVHVREVLPKRTKK